jgi:hypothetical protein
LTPKDTPYPKNRYILLDHFNQEINLWEEAQYGWGRDFYLRVFRLIEEDTSFLGLSIFISYNMPKALPQYGKDVVLVILGDEFHQDRSYFKDIACVLRCYGAYPPYCDGWPINRLKRAGLIQWMYKVAIHLKTRCMALANLPERLYDLIRPKSAFIDVIKPTPSLHLPLGLIEVFDPELYWPEARDTDYCFLGSIDEGTKQKWIHGLLVRPKVLAREHMMHALSARPDLKGITLSTKGFADSLNQKEPYAKAMARSKIALVPRGTSYETYRFNEACKAGCVIICDPLPNTEFYQGHPGIVIEDWSRLPELLDKLLADPEALRGHAKASLAFWTHKASEKAVAQNIKAFLFANLKSEYCL